LAEPRVCNQPVVAAIAVPRHLGHRPGDDVQYLAAGGIDIAQPVAQGHIDARENNGGGISQTGTINSPRGKHEILTGAPWPGYCYTAFEAISSVVRTDTAYNLAAAIIGPNPAFGHDKMSAVVDEVVIKVKQQVTDAVRNVRLACIGGRCVVEHPAGLAGGEVQGAEITEVPVVAFTLGMGRRGKQQAAIKYG
jgi:hypothetical protein